MKLMSPKPKSQFGRSLGILEIAILAILGALVFQLMSMRVYAQEEGDSMDVLQATIALVVALAGIASVIGKIITDRNKDSKVGKYLTTFGQKTVELQDEMAIVTDAMRAGSPESVKYLQDHYGIKIDHFRKRAQGAEAQLRRLEPQIPARMMASTDPTIASLDPEAPATPRVGLAGGISSTEDDE